MSFHPPRAAFLLPQNRKLRHLRGIYLRNLSFPQPRKYSVDDAAINKTTEAAELLRVTAGPSHLSHSRSSDDLRPDRARGRRVTLSGANSLARQHILEQALDSSTADAFFSLHGEGVDEPLYVSEVEERSSNFNFRFFDLVDLDPYLSRSSQMTVKIWVRRAPTTTSVAASAPSWSLLVEDNVDLRFLGCIGSLANIRYPPNALVFHLLDGIYMAGVHSPAVPTGTKKQAPALSTSSYNALMRLANLENSLQDCLATQDKLAAQIDHYLAHETPSELPNAEARQRRVAKGLAHQRRLSEAAHKRRSDITESIQARRAAIAAGRALQQKASADVEHAAKKLVTSRATAAMTLDEIRGQRRRVCEDLISIFGIVPVPSGEPLSFQVCGLPLPNTEYGPALTASSMGEDTLSAALGYVALLANALQLYLGVALPYRVTAHGSRSVIRDDISKIPEQQREFPLYIPRGGLNSQYRFDYAWFLLNKNIETLCNAQGLRVVDIRHTLPNIKYLLYVCSAGTEELPERKKGGVRGLWMGHIQRHSSSIGIEPDNNSTSASANNTIRRGSMETSFSFPGKPQQQPPSHGSALRTTTRRPSEQAADRKDTSPGGIPSSLGSLGTLDLPFDEGATTWTLRTKGMRENADR